MPDMSPKLIIYVINMKSDTERLLSMQKQLEGSPFPIKIIEAVDGRSYDVSSHPDYDGFKRRIYTGHDLEPGELGCALSHRKIWEEVKSSDTPYHFILEDDAKLEGDIFDFLEALLKEVMPCDLLRFIPGEKIYKRGGKLTKKIIDKYEIVKMSTAPATASGYIISPKTAQKLLEYTDGLWLPIDMYLGRDWMTGLISLCTIPSPVDVDRGFESTIGVQRFKKEKSLKGIEKIIYPIARAWLKITEAIGKRGCYTLYKP